MKKEYILKNAEDIDILAKDMHDLIEKKAVPSSAISSVSLIVALQGDLGAGKTTFVKAFAKTFGIQEDLSSPTFVIQKRYPIKGGLFDNLIHIDAYRLDNGEELNTLGFQKLIRNSSEKNILCIEWPEIVHDILPLDIILMQFEHMDMHGDMNVRKVTVDSKV